jgi:hypothetical protein
MRFLANIQFDASKHQNKYAPAYAYKHPVPPFLIFLVTPLQRSHASGGAPAPHYDMAQERLMGHTAGAV